MRTLPVFLVFLVMGVADAMGPLADVVARNYHLSQFMATLLTFFVFIAFALFSVPGGILAARLGKKKLLLLGLGLNTLAVAVPVLITPGFPLLLLCIFILGVGTTLLQVSGNPIMRDVSPAGAYSRNLALAQGIKGLGSFGSAWLVCGLAALLPFAMGWRSAFPIFLVLMVLALVLVAGLKIAEAPAEIPPGIGSSLSLLRVPAFLLAVVGIFLYVGAEVCMARFLKPTLVGFGLTEGRAALYGPSFFFGALTVGRLVAGSLKVSARVFFRLSAFLGLLGLIMIMSAGKNFVLAGIVVAGLGFANIWPMLFSITVEEKPERASELSGLMCMAISGGAIVPLLMGKLIDSGVTSLAYVVPLSCFAYLLLLSWQGGKKTRVQQ